jgi:hypothetical protein
MTDIFLRMFKAGLSGESTGAIPALDGPPFVRFGARAPPRTTIIIACDINQLYWIERSITALECRSEAEQMPKLPRADYTGHRAAEIDETPLLVSVVVVHTGNPAAGIIAAAKPAAVVSLGVAIHITTARRKATVKPIAAVSAIATAIPKACAIGALAILTRVIGASGQGRRKDQARRDVPCAAHGPSSDAMTIALAK